MRQSVNSELIPYGVDVSEFTPTQASSGLRELLNIGHNDIMLLCVQRLTSVKRVDMLLRMLAHVIGRHPEAVLVIVGQGPEEAKLKDLAQRLRLDSHVRFCGYVESSKLPSYYASADLFVFHSMLETFGIVFAQAMASGLPIVAASTSCVPYTIHDDNGVLVKPEDPQAFSQAVCLLIEDQEQRISIGATNRARAVQEFDWDMIAKKYEDVFERLVATS
jgi:phosphatidylinositol alpha-1,6-mannosyltransferase